MSDDDDDDFNRLMDATQTLIQLKPGDVLTQEMIDDLNLVDKDHRESFERATDAFTRGYEAGLKRGGGADTAKLIEERDDARMRVGIVNAMSSAAERWAFIKGAQVCREMLARFVEQGGTETEKNIATSIRANWRPSWGDDPGAPDEEKYASAEPRGISAKAPSEGDIERAARLFHETYERLAPQFSYTTRKASAVPWESVPENNRKLMIATVGEVLRELLRISPEMEGWQDIETAPKDGTPVLLGYFHENLDGSIYQEGGAPVVAAWIPTKKLADDGATINWVARSERLRSSRSFSPTHWMPLPEPPAIQSAHTEGEG